MRGVPCRGPPRRRQSRPGHNGRGIHAGHFSGFAADEGAARAAAAFGDAGNDGFCDAALELAGGEIVEEKQRLGPLRQHIIGAHGDQIDANGVVDAGFEGEHQLGADAVCARHQDRVVETGCFKIEQRAKSAEAAHHTGAGGGLGHRRDCVYEALACLNIDTRVTIREASWTACSLELWPLSLPESAR